MTPVLVLGCVCRTGEGREELEVPVGCSSVGKLHAQDVVLFPLGHGAALRRI